MAEEQNNGLPSVNGICVDTTNPICHDHHVYKGSIQGENAAVKQLHVNQNKIKRSKTEVRSMIALGLHRNTVRYMGSGQSGRDRILIAMEECSKNTLQDVVSELPIESHPIVMQHIIEGLKHIHENGIFHRMIKPRHILQSADGKSIKICGFGRSKWEKNPGNSLSAGYIDEWSAPELTGDGDVSEKADIFSAGLMFHYIASGGSHPFGDNLKDIICNLKEKKKEINLKGSNNTAVAEHLIVEMLAPDPNERPTVDMILRHPFFWDEETKTSNVKEIQSYKKILAKYKHLLDSYHPADDQERAMLLFAVTQCTKQQSAIKIDLEGLGRLPRERDLPDSVNFDENIPEQDILVENDETENSASKNTLEFNSLKVYLDEPMKRGKTVYRALVKGIVEDNAAVKFILASDVSDPREYIRHVKKIHEHENIVTLKSNARQKIDAGRLTHSGIDAREEEFICLAMEKCLVKSLTEIVDGKLNSYRMMLALHAINAVEYAHLKGINHGKLSPDKFLLSDDRRHLKLTASRNTRLISGSEEKSRDIIDAAKVLKLIIGSKEQPFMCERSEEVEWELFDHLHKAMYSGNMTAYDILRHPFFWLPNKKLDFFVAVGDLLDARNWETDENVKEFEKLTEVWNGPCWKKHLRLRGDEKNLWLLDSDGIIFNKAMEKKNKSKNGAPKYDGTLVTPLARFIRNCSQHVMDDCAKIESPQTLFQSRKDVWTFFARRFPTLFPAVYDFIKNRGVDEQKKFKRYFSEPAEIKALDRIAKFKVQSNESKI